MSWGLTASRMVSATEIASLISTVFTPCVLGQVRRPFEVLLADDDVVGRPLAAQQARQDRLADLAAAEDGHTTPSGNS